MVTGRAGNLGAAPTTPISESSRKGRIGAVLFFSLFLLAGVGFLIPTAILPVWRVVASRSWHPTTCTIVSSQVHSERGDHGATYRPDIQYRYTYADKKYQSDRAWPFSGTFGNQYAAELVRLYRPKHQATCYVNPANPAEAILSRELPLRMMVASLVAMVFALVGAGGIYFTLRRGGTIASPLGISRATSPELRVKQGPMTRFFVILLFALFWDGMVSFLLYEVIQSYRRGHGDLCMTIFAIPFVAIGIGFIIGLIYSFLALFNPRPNVTLKRSPLRPGEESDVKWLFTGRSDRITHLTIHLEGREEATYRRGTRTVTDKSIFFRQKIADTARAYEIASGTGKLAIPPRTMHTFAARNNKIVWELQVHGEIPNWPDATEQLEIVVLPAEVKR
jgi:hypothetical protein